MKVTPIVNKGLSFDLNYYQELKVYRGGTNYWFVDHSKLLRTKLAPFLPRMEFDASTGTVTASIVENGQELLSTSQAATPSLNDVPAAELDKLKARIQALLAEADDSNTPEPIRQLIHSFPLPKPNSLPECYRLYGSGSNKRLAIVWGLALKEEMDKEDLSSVVLLKDFDYKGAAPSPRSYTWLWILLGIAAAGLTLYCTSGPTKTAEIKEQPKEVVNTVEQKIKKEQELSTALADLIIKQNTLEQDFANLITREEELAQQKEQLKRNIARFEELKKLLDEQTLADAEKTKAEAEKNELDKTIATATDTIKKTEEELREKRAKLNEQRTVIGKEIATTTAELQLTTNTTLNSPDNKQEKEVPAVYDYLTITDKKQPVDVQIKKLNDRDKELANVISTQRKELTKLQKAWEEEKKMPAQANGKPTQKAQAITTQIIEKQNDIDKATSERIKLTNEKIQLFIVKLNEISTTQNELKQQLNQLTAREQHNQNKQKELEKKIEALTGLQQKLSQPITEEEKNQIKTQIEQLQTEVRTLSQELKADANAISQERVKIEQELKKSEATRAEVEKLLANAVDDTQNQSTLTAEPAYHPLTPDERKLPVSKQIEILKQKEKNIQDKQKAIIAYQADLVKLNRIYDNIIKTFKEANEDYATFESLMEQLKQPGLTPEQRQEITKKANELKIKIEQTQAKFPELEAQEKEANKKKAQLKDRFEAINRSLNQLNEQLKLIRQLREKLEKGNNSSDNSDAPVADDDKGTSVDGNDKGKPVADDDKGTSVDGNDKGKPVADDDKGTSVDGNDKGKPVADDDKGTSVDGNDKGKPVADDDKGTSVDGNDKGKPVADDDKGSSPITVPPPPTLKEEPTEIPVIELDPTNHYEVTLKNKVAIKGTDQVLITLNVASLNPGVNFSKVTINDKLADSNGMVQLELPNQGKQELLLKIWVDNSLKYVTPIHLNISVKKAAEN